MKHLIDSPQGASVTSPKNMLMNLRKQLRFFLEHKGVSAAELSRKAGVSKQVLSLWLGGAKPKNVEQVKKVADALNVSIDQLLFGEGIDRNTQKMLELNALLGEEWIGGFFEIRLRRVKKP